MAARPVNELEGCYEYIGPNLDSFALLDLNVGLERGTWSWGGHPKVAGYDSILRRPGRTWLVKVRGAEHR